MLLATACFRRARPPPPSPPVACGLTATPYAHSGTGSTARRHHVKRKPAKPIKLRSPPQAAGHQKENNGNQKRHETPRPGRWCPRPSRPLKIKKENPETPIRHARTTTIHPAINAPSARHPRQHQTACGTTTNTKKGQWGGRWSTNHLPQHKRPPSPATHLKPITPFPLYHRQALAFDTKTPAWTRGGFATTAASTPEPSRVAPRTPPRRRSPRRVATNPAHHRQFWHCHRLKLLAQLIYRTASRARAA